MKMGTLARPLLTVLTIFTIVFTNFSFIYVAGIPHARAATESSVNMASALESDSPSQDDPSPTPTDQLPIEPTGEPTVAPTDISADAPTGEPIDASTPEASATPTDEPTEAPSGTPSDTPTAEPTDPATPEASETPTDEPAVTPTATPPTEPTDEPTEAPSGTPTDMPTAEPTDPATPEASETPTPEGARAALMMGPLLDAPASCQLVTTDSADSDPLTFTFVASGMDIASYEWDFGDLTTATGAGPHDHAYATYGTYDITLTCVPNSGSDIVLTGSVDTGGSISPVASFGIDNGSGVGTLTFQTTNTSTGSDLAYAWSVTGPETYSSTAFEPSFTLNTVGTYTVTLVVTDTVSGLSSTAWRTIEVIDYPPDADFTLSPTLGTAPLDVTVNGVINPGSGPITGWTWDFGDGSPGASGQGPHSHTYTDLGVYWVKLDYAGPGGSGTISKQVYVDDPSGAVQADFTYSSNGNVGGGIEICFTNTSTGIITQNTWSFGDGSPAVIDNHVTVCHVYATATQDDFSVTLVVEGINPSVTSTATKTITVIAGPVADFTASSFTITWGDGPIDFSDLSTGIVTDWQWDFGDGATSTDQNPSHNFAAAGSYTVRLTVNGPGGASFVEKIIAVAILEITCDFSGDLSPYPGETSSYSSAIGNLRGRAITYRWYVDSTEVGNAATLDQLWSAAGAYLLQLAAETPDGASCTQTKTVNVDWAALNCALTGNYNPAPNGNLVTYTASVSNLQGRPAAYTWFVDGVEQVGETGSTFNRSWSAETSEIISFEVTASPAGSCTDAHAVQVEWPVLTCSVSGTPNPIPALPDDPTRSYTYTGNVTGLAGRSATYTWWVDRHDGNAYVVQPGVTGNALTLSWAWDEEGPYDVRFDVVSSANAASCQSAAQMSLNVQVPMLTCGAPIGDGDPVIGDNVTYQPNLSHLFGRTISSYTWELLDGATVVASGTSSTFNYVFGAADASKVYTLRYTVQAIDPTHTCTGQKPIAVASPGQGFTCGDQGRTWDGSGDFTPASPAANYTYGVYVDNYNGLPLEYTWRLVPEGWAGATRILYTTTSTTDGLIQTAFNGATLGPIGTYRLVVDVAYPDDHTYDCSLQHTLTVGTISVDYSFTVNNNAVALGEQICLTNSSSTSHGTIDDLTYTWNLGTAENSLGVQTISGKDLPCFSYNAENSGGYNITLTGSGGGLSASRTYVFKVFGLQSITIAKSAQTTAPANMSFMASGVNIFPGSYQWRFYEDSTLLGTRSGQSVTFYFSNPGVYRAEVTGQGNLGSTSASVEFELISTNDIRAAFTPSIYGGVAPLAVCFTDHSIGNTINYWEWDFGDSSPHLIYDAASIPATICHTYTTPGQVYNVSLLVRNATLQATASNQIRTYNLLESQSSFSINPKGSGQYCFTASIPAGASVIWWDFGDGTVVDTDQTTICHTYQSSGSYVVRMGVQQGTSTGEVSRPLNVTVGSVPQPNLTVTSSCSITRMATFTILNTGAGMLVADEIRILDRLGNVVFIDTLQLDSGQSRIITVPDMSGDVTLTALDNTLSGSVTTTCEFPPQISVAPSCISNQVTFTIHNADGPMIAPQSYEVRDASNGLILSDSFQIARNGADVVVTVPNLYSPYTFTSDGAVGTFSVTHECNPQPTLVVTTSDCSTSTISFTVQNTSSNPMVIPQSFTITRNGSADVTPPPGEFQLNGGETVTFTLPGGSNPYDQYVFVSNGFAGNLTATHDCTNPALSVTTNTCGPSVDFTVSNSGGDMLIAQSFTVTQDGIDVTAGVTPGSSFQLASGAAQTFTVAAGSDPYATYVFATDGLAGTHSLTHRCDAPGLSDLSVTTNACSDTITFTVTNSGGDMLVPQGFTLTQDGQDVTPSVTSGGAPAQEFMLARDSSQTFTVAVGSDPYAAYMFSTSGFAGAATSMHDCDHPNLSVATSICGAGVDFTITNGAGAGNMLAAQSFTITRDGAVDLTPAPGSFQLDAGESITVTLPDDVNPYARYDFTTDGFAAQMQQTHHCARPVLVVSTTCTAPVAFTVVNQGGPMLKPHHFTITPDGGYELEPRTNQFQLASGKSITFTLHGADLYSSYAFRSDEFGILSEAMHRCEAPQPPAVLPDITISQPSDRASSTLTPEYLRLNGISTDVLAMPAWTTVPVCHQGCPPWLVYHTDQTGNWEIFRLDGVDTVQRKTLNVNLSHGEGPGIDDMAPGRSPNGEWIVFTSNRDGNWEIYVAPTNGDASQVRRLTYNHVAIDTDPIWGPTNYVAYESTRDGNWEIYMMDMATGREYRITDSPASDINPFWSSDGSRLVFQSNRDGIWQIYELNLDTFKVTRLSDSQGNDLDPQYSFDGTRIAFRSYRDGASSGIYVMNADGTNPQPISALDGDATNHAWSPDDQFIAYQSDRDGDLDIYIYAVATGKTRQLTDNAIPDYAPMWKCDSETVVFTSDITGNPDIFAADALPVDAGPVDLLEDGNQMTFGTSEDIYPEGMPPEENASREGRLPPVTNRIGEQGQVLGLQTDFLRPDTTLTPPDLSLDGVRAHEFPSINACPIATRR